MLAWIVGVGLLIVLVWVTQLREGFISESRISTVNDNEPLYHGRATLSDGADPRQMMNKIRGLIEQVDGNADASPIMQKMQGLLNKYDNSDNLGHILNVKDKDPGELARMYLNINN